MKKIRLLLCICLMAIFTPKAFTQIPVREETKGIQKVTFGGVFATSASTFLSGRIKPFTLGYNLSPNVCFVTSKTYHNFLYGFGGNTIKMVNGYLPRKDLGIYTIFLENLSKRGGYISLGAEKFVKAGDVTFFLFGELGENINPTSELITLGIHANIQTLIWKKNK